MERSFQLFVEFISQTFDGRENVLDRGTFECRPTSDVKKPTAIFEASFAVALGNVQRNRLSGTKPLVTRVTMSTVQILGDGER